MLGFNVTPSAACTTDARVRLAPRVYPELRPGASAVLLSPEIQDASDDKARDAPLARHDCSGHAPRRLMK